MKRQVSKDVGVGKKPLTQTSEVLPVRCLKDQFRGLGPLPCPRLFFDMSQIPF